MDKFLKAPLIIKSEDAAFIYVLDEEGFILQGMCRKKIEEIVDHVNNSVRFKNINLTGITVMEEFQKVKEEEMEFMVAIEIADKENAIEEFYDTIQSKLGLLYKIFGVTAEEVMKYYPYHLEKIKNRPRPKE